ncbi:MAG TPA: hypothetical protein VFS20_01380 [Longimicrobium sp.]|nr:hypothetical protein [Longimicrobium sp.]
MSNDTNANFEALPVSDTWREILRRSKAYILNPGAAVPLDEALARIERSLTDVPKWTTENALRDRGRA